MVTTKKQRATKPKQEDVNEKVKCTCCGEWFGEGNFYKSSNSIYKSIGILPVCKSCVADYYTKFLEQYNDEKLATYKLCEQLNMAFHHTAYQGAVTTSQKMGWKVYQSYLSKMNSFGSLNGYGDCFAAGERLDYENENINNELNINSDNIEFTEDDEKAKKDVLKIMGYDPFAGYSKFDQKFLYSELLPYLDEDTMDDGFKLSQIIQIVNNNNQVRKIDLVINNIGSDTDALLSNHGNIKSLTEIKNKIVQNTDRIAKENSISVKNRSDGKSGKSTLGALMKDLRELDFEKAEQNYYTMKKAYGMKVSADISHKSILEILNFDTNDEHNLFKIQKELIENLQQKELDYKEEIRKLLIENKKLNSKLNN